MKQSILLVLALAACSHPSPTMLDAGPEIADSNYVPPDAFVRGGPVTMACMHALDGFVFGPSGMGVDGAGNTYLAGTFLGDVDFDPGPGVVMEHAPDKRYFVQRINRDCTLGWVRAFDPSLAPGFYVQFAVDRSGNSYLYSHFVTAGPMADFDFTSGTDLRGAPFGDDLFITAIGPNGEYRYTRTFGDTGYERPTSITVDAAGDVYFAGIFQGVVDFDFNAGPEARTVLHAGGSTTDAAFVAAIHGDGTFGWAHHTQVLIRRLAHGPPGFISAVGQTRADFDVDYGAGIDSSAPFCTGQECSRGFAALIQSNGDFGRTSYTPPLMAGEFEDIVWDPVGRSYVGGQFATGGLVDFDEGPAANFQKTHDNEPGPTMLLPFEPFVRRESATGTFDWVHHPQALQSTGSRATMLTTDIALGPDAVYVGGYYAGALIDGSTFDTTIASGFDAFIYSLDLDGNARWGLGFEADDPVDTLYSKLHIDVADDGRVTVVGQVAKSADLDLTDAVHTIMGPTTFLVTFDPLDCRERAERSCDCGNTMRGRQTCDVEGHWGTCGTCMVVAPPVCVPNCASPTPVCGTVATGCFAPLDCGPCSVACTNPDGCALPPPVELASGLDHPSTIVVDATDIYVLITGSAKTQWFSEPSPTPVPPTPDRRILRIPKAGGTQQVLAVGPGLVGPVLGAQYVFWGDGTAIVRYDKATGGTPQQVVTGVAPITLASEGNQVAYLGYVLPAGATRLFLYNIAGNTSDGGRDTPGNAGSSLALDATDIYIGVPAGGSPAMGMIYRMPRVGSGPYAAFAPARGLTQLAVDATHVYYSSLDPSAPLNRRRKDLTEAEELVAGYFGNFGFGGFALGTGVVYATELGAKSQSTWEGQVLVFDKTTFERSARARLLDHPAGIAFDGTALYVAESGPTSQSTTRGRVLRVP